MKNDTHAYELEISLYDGKLVRLRSDDPNADLSKPLSSLTERDIKTLKAAETLLSSHLALAKTAYYEEAVKQLVRAIISAGQTENQFSFYALYDEIEYHISREDEEDNWYIQVNPESESCLYDGWWSDSEDRDMFDALVEAVNGAMLIEQL